ncbi:putative sulfatase [Vibrio nigripulchritudo SFn27]|uniref:Putative sulfatase n=1 Tax=Vibrio nigripulchritudo TaxID=28173 RepID=U4KDU7_9VIBR|nr:DUF3413 domain-containing protein [Vibrio nigripulchritudo]CCN81654.1 putative sulfatase [Vibrio nigripulchritudo BLFn1]CCN88231.1 putative sulfatase [Vibrio nigripulchritudo SFn27]CCN95637.1 putative sulfatase [Vibrio nigripulchritudo ENn2]CCO39708.1 putative sulfatase [Vibrio nigripulchritudo SFn135]CCO51183.1 putative sulfatase [Vibrio nigripulchritudo Wn13]
MVDSENTYSERVSRLVSWGHWFAFFNIIAAMLIGTRYITQSPWPDTLLGQVYLAVSWLGHFAFLIFAIYILVLFPLTFLVPSRKLFRFLSACFATAGLTVLLLDTQVYQNLHLHLNPVVIDLLMSEEGNFTPEWQQFFIFVPIIFLMQLALAEWVWRKKRKLAHKHIGKPLAAVFFVCFIASHLIYIWADAYFYNPITSQRANFPLSYPMTAKSFMEKHGLLDKEDYLDRLESYSGDVKLVQYPIEPLTYESRGNKLNVLMVMVDNLRADAVSAEAMPTLHAFADQNLNYTNHYSASNDMYGVFGLFYGLPSSYAESIKAQGDAPLFIQHLQKKDYNFGLFSGDNFADKLYRDVVFKDLLAQDLQPFEKTNDTQAIENWKAWLQAKPDEPWFSYLELNSLADFEATHATIPGSQLEAQLKDGYMKSTLQADESLKSILEELDSLNLTEKTVVIVTSNHGTEFNETKSSSWGSSTNYSRFQLQVPMIIQWPGKEAAKIETKTSHLDLSPTLMRQILGVSSNPTDYSSGRSLFDTDERLWIIAGNRREVAMITDDETTVVDKFGNYKVYDADYNRKREDNPKLSILMQGLTEQKRFYTEQ